MNSYNISIKYESFSSNFSSQVPGALVAPLVGRQAQVAQAVQVAVVAQVAQVAQVALKLVEGRRMGALRLGFHCLSST